MVYNFVLPYVNEEINRNKFKEIQENYLSTAHVAIYDEILNLDPSKLIPNLDNDEQLVSCTNILICYWLLFNVLLIIFMTDSHN